MHAGPHVFARVHRPAAGQGEVPRDLFGLVCFSCRATARENALANTLIRSADVLQGLC